ncbi:MAG: acetaldehyde dehydrogenase (acetylating) [Clostridiales Family XIII bacterium]|nr:acetaldehyde dehydrogenase (acetylating) [Clostridiales Family XIII bacterium]
MDKVKVGVLGPGNIGSDLMYKILRSRNLEMAVMAGIVESEGIRRADGMGIPTTIDGIDGLLAHEDVQIVFDATSASAHLKTAPLIEAAGRYVVDLTPAAVGPYLVPAVNIEALEGQRNVNMVTCGGQATIPIVYAIQSVCGGADYAEIVACISSLSAGAGTRANIDEFTETTSKAIVSVGGAERGKAIIILNPADPPIYMTNTIYVKVKNPDVGIEAVTRSVESMVATLQQYVPGYTLRVPPLLDGDKVTVSVQVKGAGDFLPVYTGNLDIINAAAIKTAETIADRILAKGGAQA